MATSDEYAAWIVKNADKKGTPEFDIVAKAYQSSRADTTVAPAAAPAKPFGEQMNDAIADVPRQLGLTARYGIEGVGGVANFVASPFRAGLNALLPKQGGGVSGLVTGERPRDAIQPINFAGMADSMGLPQPRTPLERVVGDATRVVASAAVPMSLAAKAKTAAEAALAMRAQQVASGTASTGRVAQAAEGLLKGVAPAGEMLSANPLQQFGSAAASGAVGGYVRETGGNDTSQFLASLGAGVATPFAMNKLGQAASVINRLRPGPAPTPQQIDIQITNALQPSGIQLGDLPDAVRAGMRKDVADAFKVSGATSPDAIRRLADYRLTGATPTAGGLTLDPAIVTQQKNLAKLGINSKDPTAQMLGQTENANNRLLIGGLNELGAGTADTAITGGRKVMNALADRNARAKTAIDARYEAARATDGRSAALDPHAFTNQANDALDQALLGGKLPADVRNLLNKAAGGQMPLTVDTAEQFKTRIGDLQRSSADAAERKALGLVRQALDDTPLLDGQGQQAVDAFNKARSLNRAWMGIVDRTPALQAVRDGIEPDKFVQQFIVGGGQKANVADLAALRQSVKSSPEAMQAVKQQITSHLKEKALNGAADEVGNMSQSAYNKALNAIGDEKLAMFFAPAEINQMKAIGRVASYEQFQPKGGAVNNSNSAAAISNILDRIAGSTLLSKIPFGKMLQEPVQNISLGIGSGRALSVSNALAADAPRLQVTPRGMAMSPALLMGSDEEKKK